MSPSSTQTPQRGTGRGIGIRTAAGSSERSHGQLHVYDGDGKGKSQAALGVVLRTIGLGICEQKRTRVLLLRFLKGPGRSYDEDAAIEALQQGFPHLIDQVRTGRGDFFTADEATKFDRQEAQRGWDIAKGAIASALYSVVVLDELSPVLDLGLQPLANNLPRPEDLSRPEPRFPLRVAVCDSCWMLQITDIVPPVELFSEYLYFSSFSDALLRHSKQAVEQHLAHEKLHAGSFVVEVASNDGYLLRNFVEAGVPCLGIEPAANIACVAVERGIPTLNQFFSLELARELAAQGRQADLILGNNVFAHVPDTNDFVAGLEVEFHLFKLEKAIDSRS
jgi:ATP:corrinoid adenosyltransferase